jgi:hypothetical protein
VQDVNGILKTNGIDGAPCVATVRSYNFEHAGTAKTPEGFSGRIDLALLRRKERVSNINPDGNARKSLTDVPTHLTGFGSPSFYTIIHLSIYSAHSAARPRVPDPLPVVAGLQIGLSARASASTVRLHRLRKSLFP